MAKGLPRMTNVMIYLFHYNRGAYLENAVRSVEDLAPGLALTVVDDDSDEPEALASLERVRARHRCVVPKADTSDFKTGGLPSNMRWAHHDARKNGVKFALFLQDDMQLVRPLMARDNELFHTYFERNPDVVQLWTTFVRGRTNERYQRAGKRFECRDGAHFGIDGPGKTYSAVGLFDVERFWRLVGDLPGNEAETRRHIAQLGMSCGMYAYPFMMWLPFPTTFRGGRREPGRGTLERLAGAGLHPYRYLDDAEQARLWSRDVRHLPLADQWLDAPTAPSCEMYPYSGPTNYLYERGGWRRALSRVLKVGKSPFSRYN